MLLLYTFRVVIKVVLGLLVGVQSLVIAFLFFELLMVLVWQVIFVEGAHVVVEHTWSLSAWVYLNFLVFCHVYHSNALLHELISWNQILWSRLAVLYFNILEPSCSFFSFCLQLVARHFRDHWFLWCCNLSRLLRFVQLCCFYRSGDTSNLSSLSARWSLLKSFISLLARVSAYSFDSGWGSHARCRQPFVLTRFGGFLGCEHLVALNKIGNGLLFLARRHHTCLVKVLLRKALRCAIIFLWKLGKVLRRV